LAGHVKLSPYLPVIECYSQSYKPLPNELTYA
jgi:hypothetical protein